MARQPGFTLDDILGHPEPGDLRLAALDAMAVTRRSRRLDRLRTLARDGRGDELLAFGERNRIAPIVAHALVDSGGLEAGSPLDARCREIHDHELKRMEILLGELDAVAERLDAGGIALVALKNGGIARGIYPCPGCCPMGDVDVLIDKARFRQAHALVLECGFELASRSKVEPADLDHGLASGGTEYVKEVGGETVWFELQWRPVAGRWIRRDQEPAGSELIARSVPIAAQEGRPDTKIRLLSPEDNMLQVALHTAKHTYVRAPGLRLHTDVDRLTAFQRPDWEVFAARAAALEVKTACYFSLALARVLLGTRVPDSALDALAPPRWKEAVIWRWLRQVDLFEPDERKFSRPEMVAFTALLYDDAPGLAASVLDTERSELGLRNAPRNLIRGARRVADLLTRYERS